MKLKKFGTISYQMEYDQLADDEVVMSNDLDESMDVKV